MSPQCSVPLINSKAKTGKQSFAFVHHSMLVKCVLRNRYILLHEGEGSTGEYLVRGWQYWPIQKPRIEYSPVLPDLKNAIYLLYDLALASSINGLDSNLGRKL